MEKTTISIRPIAKLLSKTQMKKVKGGNLEYQCLQAGNPQALCDEWMSRLMAYYQQQTAASLNAYNTLMNNMGNSGCMDALHEYVNGNGNYPYSQCA